MPDATHDEDFQGSFFALEIDGLTLGWFTACSGLSLEFDVTSYKESNGKSVVSRKRKYSAVVLKRGFTTNTVIHDWFKEVVDAAKETPYKTASIVLYTRQQKECARFNLEACWPSKLSMSDVQ
ncbi:MAG TPA: phage tail protein, partial [Ilumatobacteraceae bacterium]|nr:phage tail protein [Ilumatobacteraceae bacterium]